MSGPMSCAYLKILMWGGLRPRSQALRGAIRCYTELQIHGTLQFDRDVTLVVVASRADVRSGVRRVDLAPDAQAALWRRFAARFGVQAFRMAAHGMVPLG
jgi:hypothetical protein